MTYMDERGEEDTLRLSVTRTWGNRTLPTNSYAWKKLRKQALSNSNFSCKFCGIKSKKWMVCDHVDGDATNNSIDNLGIICPICDLIRHCGRAGTQDQIILHKSKLPQIEIVSKSQEFWKNNGRVPNPEEIDGDVIRVSKSAMTFGNKLMKTDYEDLSDEDQSLRGFFTEKAGVIFNRIIPKSSFSISPHEDKSDADEPDEDELQRMYEDVFG